MYHVCEHRCTCAVVCVWRSEYITIELAVSPLLQGSRGLNSRPRARAEPPCQPLPYFIVLHTHKRRQMPVSPRDMGTPEETSGSTPPSLLKTSLWDTPIQAQTHRIEILPWTPYPMTLSWFPIPWRRNTWTNHLPLITPGSATSGTSPLTR